MSARKKILIVDDSMTARMIQQMILRAYEVVFARDGAEALAQAARERPDLILMDYVMPEMNGFEACTRLRGQPETAATPIIIVTTKGERLDREAGLRSGCNDYVTKPVDGPALLTKVKNYLGG